MIVGTTPWEKWPTHKKRELEELAIQTPCDWCGVIAGQGCPDGRGVYIIRPIDGQVTVYGRNVCYMRILRAWFNVPDEERSATALFVALHAAP